MNSESYPLADNHLSWDNKYIMSTKCLGELASSVYEVELVKPGSCVLGIKYSSVSTHKRAVDGYL